jgi:hypothetical protein
VALLGLCEASGQAQADQEKQERAQEISHLFSRFKDFVLTKAGQPV